MKSFLQEIFLRIPLLLLVFQHLKHWTPPVIGGLNAVHERFKNNLNTQTKALDLGCGPEPSNKFNASNVYGIDLYEDVERNIFKSKLGFDKLPFPDNHFDYITAYDLLEHIPRHSEDGSNSGSPFIFLMNEINRVLKSGGIFLSLTPIFPFYAAFQDPTHSNIMTSKTLELYFSDKKFPIAQHYGIKTNFKVLLNKSHRQHQVTVLQK